MFTKAYLQDTGSGKLRHEEALLSAELKRRGIPVNLFTAKRLSRRHLPLDSTCYIAGDVDAMHSAMRQLNIPIPPTNDYPEVLRPFCFRRIWKSTLQILEQQISEGSVAPCFAKPGGRLKNFTGQILSTPEDFALLGAVSRRQEIWCSEPVSWISEYRVYVVRQSIVAIDHYSGDPNVRLDPSTLNKALEAFHSSNEAPSAYGIDFGVLSAGETALVEANDGYSLGAYQIAAGPYTDLLLTRWSELLDERDENR
jgi:hypothetical protein